MIQLIQNWEFFSDLRKQIIRNFMNHGNLIYLLEN